VSFIAERKGASSLSAKGAKCKSLGQRPREEQTKKVVSAEGAQWSLAMIITLS
jgi:hypothetical protein